LSHLDPRLPVESLSVAEMQLVEIARVLARDARILIFDEPTAALADKEIARVLDVIRALTARGCSVIYVTHRLPEVFSLSDRVTVFRNGRSLPPQPTRDLTVDGVITLMLGRELETMYPPRGTIAPAPLLTVTDLTAPGVKAPFSFSLRSGEILGLTGQLGSGASAAVRALSGTLPPDSGTVTLDGKPLSLTSRAATWGEGVAYCSADRKLDGIFAGRPIRENLSSPWLDRVSSGGFIVRRAELRRAHDVAKRFAVDARRLSSAVGTLSGGNQQKVAVGKWLGVEPRVMLLDEPTRGVDIGARAEIYRHLRDLCATGLGIVVASSDTAEVLGLSDTIATFYRGRMTALRPQGDWTEDSLLREVMHQGSA
jgi:ribose transport system ATP-binding protein